MSPGVKEGAEDCVRIDEVAATLKKDEKTIRLVRASSNKKA